MSTTSLLRDYQRDVIGRVAGAVAAGIRRILIVAPTGSGKTVIAAQIAADAIAAGKRALFLVHRRELIRQSSRKLHAVGLSHGIVAATFPTRPAEPAQVASIQTLHARTVRSAIMSLPPADLVLVDEAHHSNAASWQRLIEAYPAATIVGLTATPARGDGRGLGTLFEVMVECPQVAELIKDGYLVPTKPYAPSTPDLGGVHVRHGDYVEAELAQRVDTPKLVGDIVEHWLKYAGRRPTIAFTVGVGHSVHLRDEFARAGVVAEHLDGSTPVEVRDAMLARLASGVTEVLCNCAVLTEGFDEPRIGCIILARPTKSLTLYRQIVGRGLRPDDGKDHLLVLDHSGATLVHGLIEEPVEWALSPDRRAKLKSSGGNGQHAAPVLTTCPECTAVRWQGRPCPACGWRPVPKPKPLEVVAGELGEVDSARRVRRVAYGADEKQAFYSQLLGYARERGFKPGWTYYKFKEKFGSDPAWSWRSAAPVSPTPATRSWIRSRMIAYAKQARP